MITTICNIASNRDILGQLPPPWEVTAIEMIDATEAVGRPFVYTLGKGWEVIADDDTADVLSAALENPADDWDDEPPVPCGNSPARRLRQLQRVFLVIELLAPLRGGATVAELGRDIRDDIGAYCDRTIRRDLEALEIIGLVERIHGRWYWCDSSIRAAIFERTAELRSQVRQ